MNNKRKKKRKTMKPTKTVKKEGEEEGRLRKSNMGGGNLIKVHYIHVGKYHNEMPLHN
jgi:hypothetical protein